MCDTAPPTTEAHAVSEAVRRYDDALARGDAGTAAGCFLAEAPVSRFGPEGVQLGPEEIGRVRAATAALGPAQVLYTEVRGLGPDVALHLATFARGGTRTQRTQVWVWTGLGWRISHAHVSPLAQP